MIVDHCRQSAGAMYKFAASAEHEGARTKELQYNAILRTHAREKRTRYDARTTRGAILNTTKRE